MNSSSLLRRIAFIGAIRSFKFDDDEDVCGSEPTDRKDSTWFGHSAIVK
jgi:hypothetical protein